MVSAYALHNMTHARPVLRCENCNLVQFPTISGKCRRCRFDPAKPEPVIVIAPQVNPSNLLTTVCMNPLSEAVRKVLTFLRKSASMSQLDLSRRMQGPRTYISKVENGKAVPSIRSFCRMSEALGVSPHFAMSFVDALRGQVPQEFLEENPDEK